MDLGRIRRQIGLLAVAEPELPFHPCLYHPDALDRYVQNGIRSEVLDDAYAAGPVPRVVRGANVLGAHTNRFRAACALLARIAAAAAVARSPAGRSRLRP